MFSIAICDDEKFFLAREKELIAKYMKKKEYTYIIDTFESGIDLLENGDRVAQYDIIFLDINMYGMDGIETAKQIRDYTQDTYIVFVTAFMDYSLEGYKVDAMRYLLKEMTSLDKEIAECLDTIVLKKNYVEYRQTFDFREGRKILFIDDIIYIESNLHKVKFYLKGQKEKPYTMYDKLDNIEEIFSVYNFCRIHKSYLVNMKFVESVERYFVKLSNGNTISISQPKYKNVREEFICFQKVKKEI